MRRALAETTGNTRLVGSGDGRVTRLAGGAVDRLGSTATLERIEMASETLGQACRERGAHPLVAGVSRLA